MKTIDEKKAFYEICSSILNIPHEFHIPVPKKTRWNTRRLGNGRFPGFGLIQCYGSCVRVISRSHGARQFQTYEQVYEYLRQIV